VRIWTGVPRSTRAASARPDPDRCQVLPLASVHRIVAAGLVLEVMVCGSLFGPPFTASKKPEAQ
jgi:hypothetical protein